MKVSVSLRKEDVEYLDAAVSGYRYPSRSAVVQRAIRLLKATDLADDYASAWNEWAADDDAKAWDRLAADGVEER